MNRDQRQRAHAVVAWLVKAEPGRENAKTTGWEKAVTARIRAERWAEVCAAVEANPDLSAATIAERLRGDTPPPSPPSLPTVTADQPLDPGASRDIARERIAAIRRSLQEQP